MRQRRWFESSLDDALIGSAQQEGRLTVIGMPRGWCKYGALIDSFEAKYGLTVTSLSPDASSAFQLQAIKANRDDRTLPAPDVIDIGVPFSSVAKQKGLLQPYKASHWNTIPATAKDADGFWCGLYYGVLSFEINADFVENAPQDWPDLLKPEYRGAIALAGHPIHASQGILAVYAAGLSASGSREHAAINGLQFFAELANRGNLVPFVGTPLSLAQGSTPILIRWDYLVLGDRDHSVVAPAIKVAMPKTGRVGGIYVQGISATAMHPNAARLWMEHIYSDESQLTWLKGHGRPIRLGNLIQARKVPDELLETLPETETPDEPVFPTAGELERARETITKGWDDIIGVEILCEPPASPLPPTSFIDVPRGNWHSG